MNSIRKKYLVLLFILSMIFTASSNTSTYCTSKFNIQAGGLAFSQAPPNPNVYPELYNGVNKGSDRQSLSPVKVVTPKKAAAFRTMMIPPSNGREEKLLVIPIEFTNVRFNESHNNAYFAQLTNSLKDYYEKNSQYVQNISGMTLDATVADMVQSAHTMEYYGQDGLDIDSANGSITNLASEAITLLNNRGFDFSQYDSNADGNVDHVVIIHAGAGQEEVSTSNLIWSHFSGIPNGGQNVDNKNILKYTAVSENSTLGVIAHEFGHDLGLPDLYDSNGLTNGLTLGVGTWDIMGTGSWNSLPGEPAGSCPPNLSAWSRMYLGWVTPLDITVSKTDTLTNTDGNSTVFRLWPGGNTASQEYYLIEYKRKIGYDASLPGQGLLVWHIDNQYITATISDNLVNANESRLGVELEQADGKYDIWNVTNIGDAGDPFPGSSLNTNFCAVPYGLNYSNINSTLMNYAEIKNITLNGNTASADYFISIDHPSAAPNLMAPSQNSLVDIQPVFTWGTVANAKQYKLHIADDNAFTINLREILLNDYLIYTENRVSYKLSNAQELDYGRTYYWRTAGINETSSSQNTVWSEIRSFNTVIPDNGIWQFKEDLDSPQFWFGAAAVNNKVYTIGGMVNSPSGYSYVHSNLTKEYNPLTDSWNEKANMPTPRENIATAVFDGKIYAFGGRKLNYTTLEYEYLKKVEIYDPSNDVWTAGADMPTARTGAGAAVVNGKIYVIGGYNGAYLNNIEVYDPATAQWETKVSPLLARADMGVASAGGKIYIISGRCDEYSIVSNVTEYNVDTNTAVEKTPIPTFREQFGTVEVNGKIYVVGGYNQHQLFRYLSSVQVYDPVSNSWSNMRSMQTSRYKMGVTAVGNRIYAIGGLDGSACLNVEEYMIPSDTIASIPSDIQSLSASDSITLSWNGVENADGYYILVDGVETYVNTNTYQHNGLTANGRHTYSVRAVNEACTSDWTNEVTAFTLGIPSVNASAANVVEGSEHLGKVIITLTNGSFRADGVFNRGTVTIDPTTLPQGVKQGTVLRVDANNLEINLLSDSTADYDTNKTLNVTIDKEEIDIAKYKSLTAPVTFLATVETAPAAPNVTFSFDGEDANKLVNSTTNMEYSLDEGNTYTSISQNDVTLSNAEILSITALNDIKIRIKADLRTPEGIPLNIDILEGPQVPAVTGDDAANTVTGIDNTMEFSADGTNWTRFNNNLPNLNGDLTLRVRIPASGVTLAGGITTIVFTNPIPQGVTFSFDGVNAGKLIGSTTLMEYSIDGAAYLPITDNDMVIPAINITAQNDIKIRFKAASETPASQPLIIDILQGPAAPNVTGEDSINTVTGIDNTMEFSTDGANWTRYNNNLYDLSGSVTLRVRICAIGTTTAGDTRTLTFTAPAPPPPIVPVFIPSIPIVPTVPVVPQVQQENKTEEPINTIEEQIKDESKKEIIAIIPKEDKEQSIKLNSNNFSQLIEKNKALVIDGQKVDLVISSAAIDSKLLKDSGQDAQVKFTAAAVEIKKASQTPKASQNNLIQVSKEFYEFKVEIITKDKSQVISSFNAPIKISIVLSSRNLKGIDRDKLGVYYFNESSKAWEYIGGKYNSKKQSMEFYTEHFSLYTVMKYDKSFEDIKKHWAKIDIEKMAAKHIAKGKSEDKFEPDETITRAEFTALLVRALELKSGYKAKLPYSDIKADAWYSSEMGNAYKAGIISKSDGVDFRPDINITREEMVVLINRALELKGKGTKLDEKKVETILNSFADNTEIETNARNAFAVAIQKQIIQGRSAVELAPKGNATRAEAIVILRRLLKLVNS